MSPNQLITLAASVVWLVAPFGIAAATRHDWLTLVLVLVWACATVVVTRVWPRWALVGITAVYLYATARICVELAQNGVIDATESSDKFGSDDSVAYLLIPVALLLQMITSLPRRG